MKKHLTLLFCSMLHFCSIQAQETTNKFQFSIESGAIIGGDFGLLVQVEPKYSISDKERIGLRLAGQTVYGRDLTLFDEAMYDLNTLGYGAFSIMATLDQYLGNTDKRFQPFIGGGAGFFKGSDEENIVVFNTPNVGLTKAKVSGQVAFVLRAGFQLGKFKMGAEYNLMPPTDLTLANGAVIGQVKHSYFAATLGVVFGKR